MKILNAVLGTMIVLVALLACSEKMGEKDYFTLAQEYMDQQNWEKAEEAFSTMVEKYPDGVFAAKSTFMVGYINANHLGDLEKAREYYTQFIEKYPDHELAMAAQYELEHLGQNPDELPFLQDDAGGDGDAGQQPDATPASTP